MHRYLALTPNIATYGAYDYRAISEQEALAWIKHHHNQHKEHNHHFQVCFFNQAINNNLGEITGLYIPNGLQNGVLPALEVGDEAVIVDPALGHPQHPQTPKPTYKFGLLKCIKAAEHGH